MVEGNDWALARLASELDAAEFFRHPLVTSHPYIDSGMTRALVDSLPIEVWPVIDQHLVMPDVPGAGKEALERLSGLAAFGLMERFDESVQLICRRLGISPPRPVGRRMVLSELMESEGNYRPIEITRESPALRAASSRWSRPICNCMPELWMSSNNACAAGRQLIFTRNRRP